MNFNINDGKAIFNSFTKIPSDARKASKGKAVILNYNKNLGNYRFEFS